METAVYQVKDNIILVRSGVGENPFSFVLKNSKSKLKRLGYKSQIKFKDIKGEFSFYNNEDLLFTQKCIEFVPIDVIKQVYHEEPIIEEIKTVDGQRTRIKNLVEEFDRQSSRIKLELQFTDDEMLFGLGQDEEGVYNRRGTKQYLYQHNMIIPMPFIISHRGYGVLFDASCLMTFDDTGNNTNIVFDTLDVLDYYVITGSMDDIVKGFRYLTGEASMLPKWAFGYLQSKERYKTSDEFINVVSEYRKRQIPIDGIIQDWKTWEGELWGEKIVDIERFPNLKGMNDKIHNMNVHTMISVWPNMNAGGKNHAEFAENGLMLNDYSTYNAFDAAARKMYWEQAEKELFNGGYDAWWCDSTEPFTAPDWCGYPKRKDEERFMLVGSEHKKYLDPTCANAYALMHAKGIYENQRSCTDKKRVFNLTRSGYPGIQQYGAVLWAGDTSASWEELENEIVKGISMGLCGIPYWTVDIGAFFAGGIECWRKWKNDDNAGPVWFWNGNYDKGVNEIEYKELYVRWLQFGAFLPIFRSHGTDTPREIWNFGEPGTIHYDAIKHAIEFRYKLIEYIYSMSYKVVFEDYTMMRSLVFDFNNDAVARGVTDEFMFGNSILVCPVIKSEHITKERKCYLPKGCNWYDFWSGEKYIGGQYITKKVTLNEIPLFVKEGSIIPVKKGMQYATQKASEIEIHIYPGLDTEFVLYIDDGDGYNYQKEDYSLIVFLWSNDRKTLNISSEKKMISETMNFKVLVDNNEKIVKFNGDNIVVEF